MIGCCKAIDCPRDFIVGIQKWLEEPPTDDGCLSPTGVLVDISIKFFECTEEPQLSRVDVEVNEKVRDDENPVDLPFGEKYRPWELQFFTTERWPARGFSALAEVFSWATRIYNYTDSLVCFYEWVTSRDGKKIERWNFSFSVESANKILAFALQECDGDREGNL